MTITGSAARRTATVLTALLVVIGTHVAAPSTAGPTAAAATAVQRVKLLPRQDAEVIQARPNLNLASSRRMRAKATPRRVSFIKFRVPQAIDPILSARLVLRAKSDTDTRLVVRRSGKRWRESTLTYETAPSIGGRLGAIDVAAGERHWVSLDVSQYVDGPGIYSFAVVGVYDSTAFVASSESATAPRLMLRTESVSTTTQPPTTTTTTTTTRPPTTTTTTTTTTLAPPTTTTTTQAPPNGAVMVAAGDIACSPTSGSFNGGQGTATACRQAHTSDLVLAANPDVVAALGDLQYENGELANFMDSYDPSWGRLFNRTRPSPGNHDYRTPHAAGYFN